MVTTTYKGLQIDAALAPMLSRMDAVNEHRESLQQLQGIWDSLALLGQMSGVATDIDTTRQDFHALTRVLVTSLARHTLAHTAQAMAAKAQVTIDVLVRNLFERTADVGFLATDPVLREVALHASEHGACDESLRQTLQARFEAYVAKYSVYDDVILLSPGGEVIARLDTSVAVPRIDPALLDAALARHTPYVEIFGHCALLGGRRGLLYGAAVTDAHGRALGVLCLSFRFDDEMQGIFQQLHTADDRSVIVLHDAQGQVLSSSDTWQMPCGARLPLQADAAHHTVYFGGREYLATTRRTVGYQGYSGPDGWHACVLTPLEFAFRAGSAQRSSAAHFDAQSLAGALDNAAIFDDDLRAVPRQARRIQRDLERSVWNGRVAHHETHRDVAASSGVTGSAAFSSALLREVASTGERIKDVFERAIGSLHDAAIRSVLDDMRFRAALAIDIQDRNLYERANDCRWWAMNPVLREALASPDPTEHAAQATDVLRHIHSLYTVYALLLVFDRQGRVVAVSRPDAAEWIGQRLDADWVPQILSLHDNQHHVVSRLERSALYGDEPTLIYGAAIFPPNGASAACGGIANVFDTAPQLSAMLSDCLPAHGQAVGLLVESDGTVRASTDARYAAGSRAPFALPDDAAHGASRHAVLAIDGTLYAVGLSPSRGYREYGRAQARPAAGHPDETGETAVMGVMLMPLCPATADEAQHQQVAPTLPPAAPRVPADERVEIASFVLGEQWLGLPAQHVVEAIEVSRLTTLPNAPGFLVGLLAREQRTPIPVIDLALLRGQASPRTGQGGLVVICRDADGAHIGVLVDQLAPVFEAARDALLPVPLADPATGQREQLLKVPRTDGVPGHHMLILLALEALMAPLMGHALSTPMPMPNVIPDRTPAPHRETNESLPVHATAG